MQKRSAHKKPVVADAGCTIAESFRDLGPVVYATRTREGLIKIGWTANLYDRARQVGGIGSILAWRCGTLADEQAIHGSLAGVAHRGREWYPPVAEVLTVVNAMRADLGIDSIAA